MGGAPKGNSNASKQAKQANGCFDNQKQAKQANGFENNQKQAKQPDNVNVNVNDNVNDNVVSVVNNTQEQQKRQYIDLYTQNVAINLCSHPQAVLFIRTIKTSSTTKKHAIRCCMT